MYSVLSAARRAMAAGAAAVISSISWLTYYGFTSTPPLTLKAPAMHINDKLRRAVLVGQLRKYRRRITTVGICMLELGRGRGVWLGLELLV